MRPAVASPTLADRLTVTHSRPAGFDWMRLLLAAAVVGWHTIGTSYGDVAQHGFWSSPLWRPPLAAILGMFFALSGFLVAGSLERCRTMVSFVGLRVMRILPALAVEVLLCALILGPLLTHYSLHEYFVDRRFWHYLANMLGIVHFVLPGVFLDNPWPSTVNAQLWTVPYELRCYEVLLVLSIVGFYRRKAHLVGALIVSGVVFFLFVDFAERRALPGGEFVFCFLLGVGLHRFRDSIAWSAPLAALSAVLAAALLLLPRGDSLAPIPLAYLTVYLGLLDPPRVKWLFAGDYSYGLFLYGFPIEQAVASAGPWAQHWYISVALAYPLTAAVAVGSWWWVEKPVLSQKATLRRLEDLYLVIARFAARRHLT